MRVRPHLHPESNLFWLGLFAVVGLVASVVVDSITEGVAMSLTTVGSLFALWVGYQFVELATGG